VCPLTDSIVWSLSTCTCCPYPSMEFDRLSALKHIPTLCFMPLFFRNTLRLPLVLIVIIRYFISPLLTVGTAPLTLSGPSEFNDRVPLLP
jgi:hypothetical protein